MQLQLADLQYLAPELTLVIAAVVLALLDLIMPKQWNRQVLGPISLLAVLISGVFVVYWMNEINGSGSSGTIELLAQSYRVDDFANLMKLVLLTGTALILLMSFGNIREKDIPHKGEYYYLFLPATLGAMMMVSSGDMITLYIGLELMSITSYVMVGLRKMHEQSNESAFKYIVNGSIASAFILYGMSFLYGMSGTTNLIGIWEVIRVYDDTLSGLVYLSAFLMIAGFGFKVAAAPFHAWAPDVYQGAPGPIAAYLGVVSKAAALAVLFRVIYNVYFNVGVEEAPIYLDITLGLSILAAASMIIGTAMALKQRNMRRLLALSGVANAGYLLVPIAVSFGDLHFSNFAEFYYYLIAYLFMNIGAFAVLLAVSRTAGHDEMKGFAGLYYRAPYTAVAMTVFLLSLAGLPVTGGFFGKLYIMLGTLHMQMYWLAAIMIATSIASFYVYFSIIRQMYMRRDPEDAPLRINGSLGLSIWICVAATIVLGLFPNVVFAYLDSMFSLFADFFYFS